ncbi:MAG: PhnD/SsuA/transferrin family substrate-binding protein [Rhizobiaceae bacterium]
MNSARFFKSHLVTSALTAACLLAFTTASWADWRKDLGVFRIGMIESEALKLSPAEMARIRSGYADALAMPVEIIRMRDFPALIDAQVSARVEYTMLSAAAYSTAYLLCECVEPLVQPVSADAVTGTRTVLFMDESAASLPIAATKGIAVPDKNSLNGYGVLLASGDVGAGKLTGNEPWLKFFDSTDAAVQQYADGNVDGFFATVASTATLATALEQDAALTKIISASGRNTKAVWISEPIANGPHAVRKNLATEAKDLLSKYLVSLVDADPDLSDILLPDNGARYQPVTHSAYTTAIAATKKLATQGE